MHNTRDNLIDELMDGRNVGGFTLDGILEGEMTLAELIPIFRAPFAERQDLMASLESRARGVVDRFVDAYCTDLLADLDQSAREDADERNEYSPDRRAA